MAPEVLQNGIHRELEDIKRDLTWIRSDLGPIVVKQSAAMEKLSASVDYLAVTVHSSSVKLETKFEAWLRIAETLIPVTFMSRIFGWVFAIIMGILFGVEAVRWLFSSYLPSL